MMMHFQRNKLFFNGVNRLLKINTYKSSFKVSLCGTVDRELLNILSPNSDKFNNIQDNIKSLYKSSKTFDELEKNFTTQRPKDNIELTDFLRQFNKFLISENSLKAIEFFTREKIDIAIRAHILSHESSINDIFETSIFFINFLAISYGNLQILNQHKENLELLNGLLNKCYKNIKEKSFSQLPIDTIITLYFTLKKHKGEFININLINVLEEKVMLNVNDTTSINFILAVLRVMDLTPDQYKTVFKKAQELLPNLSINDSASLMYCISLTKNRPLPLLQEIVQHMEFIDNNSITLNNLVKLTQALESLSFQSIHALRLICRNIVSNINTFTNANHITTILTGLSAMNCGNEVVWNLAEKWLENNYRKINIKNILPMVTALGKINCSAKDIDVPLNYFSQAITIRKVPNSTSWLRYVYGMTILGKLTPRMAESILKEEFINDLLKGKNDGLKFYLLNLVAQIDCAARYELVNFNSSMFQLNNYINVDKNLIEKVSNMLYDKRARNFVAAADIAIKRIVGSEKKLSGPRILQNGLLINNTFSHTIDGKIDNIEDWDEFIKNNCSKKIGVIYISNKHMMRDVDTGACIRENGSVALKIRLLNKLGFDVVRIYEHEFDKNSTALENINYVKKEIEKHLKL